LLYDASEDELGLLLTTKLKFHDIGGDEEIFASADGHLEINAGTTLDITAPTVDLNSSTEFNIDTAAYDLNASGAVTVDAAGVSIDSSAASNLTTSSGALTVTSAAAATWSTAAGNLTLDSAAGSLVLDGHTGAQVISSNSGEVDITSAANVDINATTTVTVDGTGVSIDGTDDSNLTVTGSNKDLAISVAGGSTQTLTISSAGTGTNAIDINATAGGIDIDANGAISLDSAAGSIDMNVVDGQTVAIGLNGAVETLWKPHGTAGNELWSTINTAGTTDGSDAAGSILLSAVAGGIGLAWADGKDLWAEGGRFVVTANEDAADAIKLHADAGTSQTIQIVNDAGTTDGSDDAGAIELSAAAGGIGLAWADGKDLWAEGGRAVITANEDAADAIKLHADAGTSQTITIVNDAGTGAAAIGLTASAGGITVGLGGGAGDDFIVDTDTLVVESDNNRVGIGTDAPYEKLGVEGNLTVNDEIVFAPTTNGNAVGYINFDGYQAGNSQFRDLSIGDGKRATVMYVDGSAGNVGIGTPTPAERLTVKGAGDGWTDAHFAIEDHNTTNKWDFVMGGDDALYIAYNENAASKYIAFESDGDLLVSGGSMGIGIAPVGKLDIAQGGYTAGTQALHIGADSGDNSSRTNSTSKYGVITSPHYSTGEENIEMLTFYSNNTDNILGIGGSGNSAYNSLTQINFRVAANDTTTSNSATTVMILDSNSRISLSNNDSGGTGGLNSTTGNTVFGYLAGQSIDSGSVNNTFIGHGVSDASMNDAIYNVGIGSGALSALTTGDYNIVIGGEAGAALTTGERNIFIGHAAGNTTADVSFSVMIGHGAGNGANITDAADGTVAIGNQSLAALTTGARNLAIGSSAVAALTTGGDNVMIGYQAAVSADDGGFDYNVGVGN